MKLNQTEIKQLLPHREPLLLLDSVTELIPGNSVTAAVTIRPDWQIFQGHFPDQPLLPGIYITESMAQAAALILLSTDGNQGHLPLLFQIQKMRFIRPVVPGDVMELKAVLTSDAGNGMYDFKVSASVHEDQAASGIITLTLK